MASGMYPKVRFIFKQALIFFKFSQKDDYGRTPEYINRRKKEMAEAQKEYDAYVQV